MLNGIIDPGELCSLSLFIHFIFDQLSQNIFKCGFACPLLFNRAGILAVPFYRLADLDTGLVGKVAFGMQFCAFVAVYVCSPYCFGKIFQADINLRALV
jgi:hypothetical protein